MSFDCPWLSISNSDDNWSINEYTQAFPSLGLTDFQTPDLVTFIGGYSKSKYLRQLIDASPVCLVSPHNQVHLWTDPITRKGANPRIYIDCGLQLERAQSGQCCFVRAPNQHKAISWFNPDHHVKSTIAHTVCNKVLLPLASVVCYFASDLGGLQGTASLLAEHIVAATACSISPEALPSALIIIETSSPVFDAVIAEVKFLQDVRKAIRRLKVNSSGEEPWAEILDHFREVRLLALQKLDSPSRRAQLLRNRLNSICHSASLSRRSCRMLLSLRHVKAFSELLISNMCSEKEVAFDFIKASRPVGFSTNGFTTHLKELFDLMPSQAWLWHTICPLVGSALLLASYPPGSHYFDPEPLFSRLYRGSCDIAMIEYTIHSDVRKKFTDSVKFEFVQLFDRLVSSGKRSTAQILHAEKLTEIRSFISTLKSHRVCLCCLMRMPEKVLCCGHAFCDVCIQTFGNTKMTDKHTYVLNSCILCGTVDCDATFNFIPPTAGIRLLSLDGGGVRGIIELVFLQHLETQLCSLMVPLRSHFDFICGTSAGGLIVLGLFLMDWSVDDCLKRFEALSARTFQRTQKRPSSLMQLQRIVLSYVRDFKYESTTIEDAFRQDSNHPAKMFNPLRTETKVAVTTTTAREVHPCLFSNYNGHQRPSGIGYQIVRAQNHQHDVTIEEAASCTSAAPWFFKPKVIKNLGTFQDGGLQHNNPLGIALRECQFIWPGKGDPDVALSVGSGTNFEEAAFGPRSPVRDKALPRLYRALMRSFDGEKTWKEFINAIPENQKSRYHRFNLDLKGPEPDIDDVASMQQLKSQTEDLLRTTPTLKHIRDSLFASIFYFELEDIPEYTKGMYACVGNIFCRLNLSQDGRKALYEELRQGPCYFLIDGQPIPCVDRIPKGFPLYRKRIQFNAAGMDQQVSITIGGISNPKYISGLPKSLKKLIDQQRLDAPFGRADHYSHGRRLPAVPSKRKLSSLQSGDFF